MKFYHKITIALVALLGGLIFLFSPDYASAISRKISISPAIREHDLSAGSTTHGNVVIENEGKEEFDFSIVVSPYQVKSGSYEAVFDEESDYTQISKWIHIEKTSGHLAPGEKISIEYNIVVPDDVPSGGQYAVIRATTNNDNGSIAAASGVGAIIMANVAGETRQSGEILSQTIAGFLFQPPVRGAVSLSNTGNISATATVTMKVEDYFSGAELYNNSKSPNKLILLPETTRDAEVIWDAQPLLGVYRVNLTTDYLNDINTATKIIILCPIWLIVILICIVVALIVFIIIKSAKKSRRNNSFRYRG